MKSQVKMFSSCESQVQLEHEGFNKDPQVEESAKNAQDSNSSKN